MPNSQRGTLQKVMKETPKAQKRSSSADISHSAILDATSALQGLPEKPKENWSLREAVTVLQDSITNALNKGYTYAEVSQMLSQKGVQISASSLRSYLASAKQKMSNNSRHLTTPETRRPRVKAAVAPQSTDQSSDRTVPASDDAIAPNFQASMDAFAKTRTKYHNAFRELAQC
ncbi:MAG: hypothetical protein MUF49_30170 [Oculatellaceae cyanobacterium Prado106]|nr:hypothetical protein [Oculatellaceae cyanobacterium Prado106]